MKKEEELLNFMSLNELNRAKIIEIQNINYIGKQNNNGLMEYYFKYDYNNQKVITSDNNIINAYCDWFNYSFYGRCFHVNSILYNYYDLLKNDNQDNYIKNFSIQFANSIFNKFKDKKK